MTLPPGQRATKGFPRFGTHLHEPPPVIPEAPAIEVAGTVVPVAELAALPRREVVADFHCVTGWSATGLRWEGVLFAEFHRRYIAPATPTHIGFIGHDGYRSIALLEDVMHEDVLVADRLDGRPLDGDHGAPVRLVSPAQYGYVNTKHLCRIELYDGEPGDLYPTIMDRVLASHPRARVAEEERHRFVPGKALRLPYRALVAPIRLLSARGSEARRSR